MKILSSGVDLKNKVVFNGSSLGKEYSASAILQRLGTNDNQNNASQTIGNDAAKTHELETITKDERDIGKADSPFYESSNKTLLDDLIQVEPSHDYLPYPLTHNKKKRNKRKNKHRNL